MKKPWAVRIVEALGWTYVALYAGGLIFAFCVIYGDTGFVDAALVSGVFLLPQLCLPIGMVVALREGRRAWFIWPHTILVALIAFVCIFLSQLWFVTVVAIVLIAVPIALIAIPIVLLFRPEASIWFAEMSGNRRQTKYGRVIVICSSVLIFLLVVSILPGLLAGMVQVKASAIAVRMRPIYCAIMENNSRHANGVSWVDPDAFSNSTDFIQALGAEYGDAVQNLQNLGRYTNIWCVVVNPPDDDWFPVLFTANVNPADVLGSTNNLGHKVLTCPKQWGGECFDVCEEVACVISKGGAARKVKGKYINWVVRTNKQLAQCDTIYVLTPTGRVSIVCAPLAK